MASEPEVANLALLQRVESGVDCAVVGENPIGVVVVDDFVKLPQVDMIGLQPAKAVVEVRLRALAVRLQTLVIRKTLSRRLPSARALPIRSSARPSW